MGEAKGCPIKERLPCYGREPRLFILCIRNLEVVYVEISPLATIGRRNLKGASLKVRRPQVCKYTRPGKRLEWARKVIVGVEKNSEIGEIFSIKTGKT